MSGWQGVLDQQLDLFRFWRSEIGIRTAYGYSESMIRQGELASGKLEEHVKRLAGIEAGKMYQADPFHIDPDMWALVEAAGESFKPEPLQESDLLTQHGFVVLPRSFSMLDRHDKKVSCRAFAWEPLNIVDRNNASHVLHTGIHLSLYSHTDDVRNPEIDDYGPQFTAAEHDLIVSRTGTPYSLAHATPWVYGDEMPGEADANRWTSSWWRPVQSFLRLTLQTIGERYQQQPPRASRKRWERVGKPKEDRYITVVRLRRPRGHAADGEASTVEWQQRWVVNGHWRNQWYPSLNLHRQVWISPYVKGPDDKPLLVRKGRVFELVR